MKAIITLSIVLFFGVVSQAQSKDRKNPDPKKSGTLKLIPITIKSFDAIKSDTQDYVLLSKFKNTRVKKALLFTTRNNKTKMT